MKQCTERQGQPLNLSFGEETLSLGDGDSNAMILPNKKNNKRKSMKQECVKLKAKAAPRLTNSQKKKLKKLEEEKEKALLLSKSIETLKRYNIPDDAYSLLQSSRNIGQVESIRVKRRKSMEYSKAGFEAPDYDHQSKQSGNDSALSESEPELDEVQARHHYYKNNPIQPMRVQREVTGNTSVSLDCFQEPICGDESGVDILVTNYSSNSKVCNNNYSIASREENDCVPKNGANSINSMDKFCMKRKETDSHGQRSVTAPTVVHVSRPDEVENKRKDIPIVMMEQEIMEAINEHSTVIICGETGCGKTTQVPQFLYEAGFGSKQSLARCGIIGVTQPRRVAVLATAKRVAYELGLSLGKEVGFQVRYDKKIGNSSSIKFMTDGILLRELQNDFLLRRYSIIILDEAHERSLNTDILIGMLSRVIQGREKLYAQQQKLLLSGGDVSPENMIFPLKLVLMSATLRVEDFISGQRLFHEHPPVLEVHTRQFPVTIHFSKRTETIDYIGQAYKKVLAIHKRLPPGGILVFLTGQREVEYLCKKLRRASKEFIMKTSGGNMVTDGSSTSEPNSVSGINIKDINEAYDIDGSAAHQQTDRFSTNDNDDDDDHFDTDNDELDFSYDSGSESELEMLGDTLDPEHHKIPEADSKHVDVLGDNASVASLKAAFESLAGQSASNSNSDKKEAALTPKGHLDQSDSSTGIKSDYRCDVSAGVLRVLPLYALLPAAAQLRVFEEVKEGERLVVVATNVAETSLTIPGIKYVVDTGREKVKNYNTSNGMETYEVQWISKASAAQRAGRSGRTGPGHCYRLYSSAVYNNIFSEFSLAEILKVPVDGVVLLMKSMHIDKVTNFPFPTPPDAINLREAERCLKALEALDSAGKLTVLGKAMARFPMSPRHSRMLLTVVQIMKKKKSDARPNLVLAYAAAAAAALSLPNPFVVQYENSCSKREDLEHDENLGVQENKKVVDKQEKLRKKKIKETLKASREKFCNPGSDALSIAYALQCFELSNRPEEFCNEHALHLKTMVEMSKLRKQLLQLVFNHSNDFGIAQEYSWTYGNSEDIEQVWRVSYDKHPLLLYEEELLGQAICAGWADRVAKRVRGSSGLSEEVVKVHAARYQACMVKETVFLHRLSSVSNSAPEFLVYSELLQTKRPYMHGVTRVKPEWLVEYARPLCTFSMPSVDMRPYYDPQMDQVLHYVIPTFGPYLWELSPSSMPIGDNVLQIAVFAYALLEGQVLPCLKSVRKFMAAPPSSILRPEASGQKRVGNLLSKLKKKSIDSCVILRNVWMENPKELYSEIMDWFQETFRKKFETLWTEMLREILLEVHERFPKKLKRVRSKK